MNPFNTTPVGILRNLKCFVCDDYILPDNGVCQQRKRGHAIVAKKVGAVVTMYNQGDAVMVSCVRCQSMSVCEQATPFNGRYVLVISGGNVYAKIRAGRLDEPVTITAKIHRHALKPITVTETVIITR